MALVDRIAKQLGFERRATYATGSWDGIFGANGLAQPASVRGAENLAAVLACVTVISTALASLPTLIYRRENGERFEAHDHPLLALVRGGANAYATWPDFIESLIASTLLTGNGLAAIERGPTGGLTGLRFIPWNRATALLLPSGRLAYDIMEPNGARYRLLQGEVVHLRDRTDDGKIGRSRLSRAADTVDAAIGINQFARAFITQGAYPSGVLTHPGRISEESVARLRESFEKQYTGTGERARRVMILEDGMTWAQAQISPEDAEVLASRKFSVEEICRVFNVQPPLIQDYSNNTFTNAETAGRWFAHFTLLPWARKIEAEFARSVLGSDGPFELELDLAGFLRGDPKTRWEAHKIAIEAGVLDPDEVRAVEGYNPRTTQLPAVANAG